MFAMDVASVEFTQDEYSLNSVSGRAHVKGGPTYFFKFHQEDGEQEHVGEYYRADLLSRAGLPVEVPVATSSRPGAQMVLYRLRSEPRLADVCAREEREHFEQAELAPSLLSARRALDAVTGQVLVRTLRPPQPSSARAAIHQLFHHRLVDGTGAFPGGRYAQYYCSQSTWAETAARRWVVDGIEYRSNLAELASNAARLLAPERLAGLPVVTAHGDDHQGNVWVTGSPGHEVLALFDPAFAGDDIPALLAPVKATFHNCLAHPFWLYHPSEAGARAGLEVSVRDDVVEVSTAAPLSKLRLQILQSGAELVWAPLLKEMAHRGALPADWRETVRAALFCCPMLVTNLVSPARPSPVRWLGLARSVVAGSEPVDGSDVVSAFLDMVAP